MCPWKIALAGMTIVGILQPPKPLTTPALRHVAAVSLPGVSGRIDHLAFETTRQRLYIAALGNNTVEVVDAANNVRIKSLTGFHEPQGVAVLPEYGAVAVANGASGTLQLIDTETFATRWTVNIGGDADNVRYDAASRRIYVAAEGGLYAVDPSTARIVSRLAIQGHPESFQLERDGVRIFTNLPALVNSKVVAGNRSSMTVTAQWATQGCGGNYPMALDEPASRLFVGCRRPARLAMIDAGSGSVVTSIDIVGDTDDLFYDAARHRVYVIGEGHVDVLTRDGDRLQRLARITTRGGARTGLWVPSQSRLYVAVPARSGEPAEIRVFQAETEPRSARVR